MYFKGWNYQLHSYDYKNIKLAYILKDNRWKTLFKIYLKWSKSKQDNVKSLYSYPKDYTGENFNKISYRNQINWT